MHPILKLVRISLSPTAPADSWAGFFISHFLAQGTSQLSSNDGARLAMVAAVSILTYWVGMITNDIFDLAKDKKRSADRPLAEGEVSLATAVALAVVATAIALMLAWIIGVGFLLLLLFVALFLYNGGGKRIPAVGNLLMGSCRSLNLLVGAAAANSLLPIGRSPEVFLAALVLGLYIAGVTAISLLEDRRYQRRPLRLAWAALLATPVVLVLWGWRYPGAWVNGFLFSVYLARGFALPREPAAPTPHPADLAVRRGLKGLYFVDAGLLWCFNLAWPSVAIYALMGLSWIIARSGGTGVATRQEQG